MEFASLLPGSPLRDAQRKVNELVTLSDPAPACLRVEFSKSSLASRGSLDELSKVMRDLAIVPELKQARLEIDLRNVQGPEHGIAGMLLILQRHLPNLMLINLKTRLRDEIAGFQVKQLLDAIEEAPNTRGGADDLTRSIESPALSDMVRDRLVEGMKSRLLARQNERRTEGERPTQPEERLPSGPALDLTTEAHVAIATCRYAKIRDGSERHNSFSECLAQLTRNALTAGQNMILDLSNVEQMPSDCYGPVVAAHLSLTTKGLKLVIVFPEASARKALETTRLNLVIPCHESVEEARKFLDGVSA